MGGLAEKSKLSAGGSPSLVGCWLVVGVLLRTGVSASCGDLVGGGAPAILTGLYKCPMSVRDHTPCHLHAFVMGENMRVPVSMLLQ